MNDPHSFFPIIWSCLSFETAPVPKDVQFFEYAEQWYKLRKEPFVSAASRASYKSCFIKHLLPEFGLQNLRAIDAAQIQKFVNTFAGSSKSQIVLIIGTLKGIFSAALAEGIIDRDPTGAIVRPKATKKDERRPLTKEETERVLSTMRTNPEGLLLAVLYYLGVRRGEALGLQWGDFDFTENQAHVQRDIDYTGSTAQAGELKTKASDRFVPVPNALKEMLLAVKGKKNEYVFHTRKGKPISEASFRRMWLRLMMDCGCVSAFLGAILGISSVQYKNKCKRQIIDREISRNLSLYSAISRYLQESPRGIDSTGTSETVFV